MSAITSDGQSGGQVTVTLSATQAEELFREMRGAVAFAARELATIDDAGYEPGDREWPEFFSKFDERRALLNQLPALPNGDVTVTTSARLLAERARIAAEAAMRDIGDFGESGGDDFNMTAALRALDRARDLLRLVVDVRLQCSPFGPVEA